jgi:replicative DNA helicase Mcm
MAGTDQDLTQRFIAFYREYYRNEVGKLAQRFPRDQRSLEIDYGDLFRFDRKVADDFLKKPEQMREYAEEALYQFDLPANVDLTGGKDYPAAHVRVSGLNEEETYYPGEYSPKHDAGEFIAVEGQVHKATDQYATILEASFECQRCGTMSYIPQDDEGFQEPHECTGCERQGPFNTNHNQSVFVDSQKIRVQEPPERTANGTGDYLDVYVQDDLVYEVEPGDKVVVCGTLNLEQKGSAKQKENVFIPYMDGHAITLRDTEFEEIELDEDDIAESQALVDGGSDAYDRLDDDRDPGVFEEITGEPRNNIYDLAIESLAPTIFGYDIRKLSYALQLVGGVRVENLDGTYERGDFHILDIGDPSTAKSQMLDAVAKVSPRSVTASGRGATEAGMTAAAVQDDFADTSEWTLEGGALVTAHKGVAAIDELDKVPEDVVESMHRAMAQQEVNVNKAGINTSLPTQTAVHAAANPTGGRWDQYQETHEQIDLVPTLLSRFGLIWKFEDRHEEHRDKKIARHTDNAMETAKRVQRGDNVPEEERQRAAPLIDHDLLRKHIARAKRDVKAPVYANPEVQGQLIGAYVHLRNLNGRDDDVAIPVTPRKLKDMKRIAEAAAKFELSETIEEHHVEIAKFLIRKSMEEFGQNEEGEFDADVVESGTSRPQEERKKMLLNLIKEMQPDDGGSVSAGELLDAAEGAEIDRQKAKNELEQLAKQGELYRPGGEGTYRVFTK